MDSKKVNIVTINLNNKDGLEKTIKSVVEQTYFDKVNYIVIDGESTDGSVDVIKNYDDKITHWVSEKDDGVYNAMNKGVDLCNGEYVLFLNSGDYFHDNKVIEDVYEELDTDIVYGALNVHAGKRQYIINDDYYLNKGLPHPSTFTKTELLRENKFNEDYKIISDWIFFYETIYLKRTNYKRLNRVISDFFIGGISSNAKSCNQEKERYLKSLEKDDSYVKIAMCSIGRLENKYAVEFVDFYEKMGVDKFYIYDNNYGDEEHFEEVLKPYVDNGLVEIINYRDKSYCQVQSYQDCYDKHGKEFDWICFFDFDEYILLSENLKTMKQLLSLGIYNEYDVLHINELIYGDSEKLRYENIPLTQRFTKPVQPIDYKRTFNFPENCHVKTIVRGGLDKVSWNGTPHTPTNTLKCCNAAGEPCKSNSPFVIPYCYKNVCLRHYKTKTLEEYYEIKVKRGYPDGNKDLFKNRSWIDEFFKENVKTKEKLEFINELLEREKIEYDCKIGVVIPCYNSEAYIEETIDSLKKQTFTDWKCVIVNDGSTDNSEEVINRCLSGDSRFSYIKQENHGLPYTRNVGIRSLNSKYIFCLDSDDIIDERYFELGVEFLDNNPDYSVFYGKAKFLYEDGTTKDWNLPEYNYLRLLRGNMIYCSFLYRRFDYEKTNGYDETMKGFEDWEFLIRLLPRSGKVYRSEEVLFYYRQRKNSMDKTYNRGDNRIKMLNYIYNKNHVVYEKCGISLDDLLKRYVKKTEKKDVCIVLPIHKERLDTYEMLSFLKCLKTFGGKRKIKLVIPENISDDFYKKYSALYDILKVKARWMDSFDSYNELLCNKGFWKLFDDFEYVLIYQVDCWVYKDELDDLIKLGYDYYGAPWPMYNNKVGNGGLSLRKVSKMIEICEKYTFKRKSIHEDGWYCLIHNKDLNICPLDVAVNFSLEIPSDELVKMIKDIPMGLHGKYLVNLWNEEGDRFREYKKEIENKDKK